MWNILIHNELRIVSSGSLHSDQGGFGVWGTLVVDAITTLERLSHPRVLSYDAGEAAKGAGQVSTICWT